jgi:acetyl esterase/lipase
MTNKLRFQSAGIVAVFLALLSLPSSCHAQSKHATPTHKDVAYDSLHPSQALDIYLAKSDKPTAAMIHIHGGGWRAGSKNNIPAWLSEAVSEGWLSVVSIEYRFTDVATHPAQVNDCMHAIQFVRQHAQEWNIDTKRIGVTGGSAGGHLSLWVALHDDIADPNATDPARRQSSRVACAVSFAGPTDWSLLADIEHKHPAYRQLIGYEPTTPLEKMEKQKISDVSPISFATQDDPPVMQVHGDQDDIVPIQHARRLESRLKSIGVKTELVVIEGGEHSVAGAAPPVAKAPAAFVRGFLKP